MSFFAKNQTYTDLKDEKFKKTKQCYHLDDMQFSVSYCSFKGYFWHKD